MNFQSTMKLFKNAFQDWQEDKVSRLAAALAYYTIFSLAPLLIIAIGVAGAIFGEEAARGEIFNQINGMVGADGAQFIETAINNANKPGSNTGIIASIIGLAVLLFGASGVFAELQDSLNTVWEVKAKPNAGYMDMIRKRFLSFSMVLGIGFLLLVSLIISAGLSAMGQYMSGLLPGMDWLWKVVNFAVSFGVVTLLFAMMYKFLPDVKISWNNVWFGAVVTALLFTIGKFLLGLYLGRGSFASTYGAAGSLVIIIAWVYYAAQILFFGAEITQVHAHMAGESIQPNEHAMRVTEEQRANEGLGIKDKPDQSDDVVHGKTSGLRWKPSECKTCG